VSAPEPCDVCAGLTVARYALGEAPRSGVFCSKCGRDLDVVEVVVARRPLSSTLSERSAAR